MGNLYDWFRAAWDDHLDDVSLDVPGGLTWTYGDLDVWAARLANTIAEWASVGDRVVVQVEKSPYAVVLYLACLRGGFVYVPLNTAYTAVEVGYFLDDAAPALFVGDASRARGGSFEQDPAPPAVNRSLEQDPAPTSESSLEQDRAPTSANRALEQNPAPTNDRAPENSPTPEDSRTAENGRTAEQDRARTNANRTLGQDPVPTITRSMAELIDAASASAMTFASAERTLDDWVAMLYTSGTTGRSKGAMLSGGNLASNAEALRRVWHWQPDDVLCHGLPIFHVHGLFVALHCALLDANRIHFLDRFDPDLIRSLLPQSTVFMGVPTHYRRLLDAGLTKDDTANMRLFTSGSAPMTEAVHAEFTAATGHQIVERYGMTESMIITSNPFDGERVPGTVGFGLDGIETRVADADGVEVERGDTGIVECRGPNTMLGYWGLPDKTAETIRPGGWLITGDVGSMDADGRITLAGRSGDMIISGGLNVYPKEIELVLDTIDGVAESAVIGVPHPDFGEAVVAVLATSEDITLEPVVALCRTQLASFKHPKAVVCVDMLPRNTMGKIQKHALRTTHAHLFVEGSTP